MKIGIAKQSRMNNYKNNNLKLINANVAVGYNMMCSAKQLKPNYVNIRNNGKTPQDKKNSANAIRFRINQEICLPCRK